jgi:hypothetical protein
MTKAWLYRKHSDHRTKRRRWAEQIAKELVGGVENLTEIQRVFLQQASLVHVQLQQVNQQLEFEDRHKAKGETAKLFTLQDALTARVDTLLRRVQYAKRRK